MPNRNTRGIRGFITRRRKYVRGITLTITINGETIVGPLGHEALYFIAKYSGSDPLDILMGNGIVGSNIQVLISPVTGKFHG